ncbi:N-acetyl-1-D-myo-inositol-2-amino-2-deoxy-alpha-D-glucopyranoside deacetylase [Tessaracoccus sp. OS52]|uniref:N-acetyl-1-D-myo-inositol-2-amino-2-deoxy-alpha- D-glucopyranoside deacetylase n=1 Tax=Tessaracoccus sp. OS52 TaxID=2886691 RepID=UPI001D12B263|nr:N-acetyl-1-D-myo-inositol-2-amino-2-deoxy-alpha-D-glucopyranoside deacetylase [Tessaracoccus sp. OS52]
MSTNRRILFVHAHPDDESSQSAGSLSRYVAEGAQVTLVTCTLGEMGEILVDDWAHFSPEELGKHRLSELAEALGIMGVTDHVWLGGPGRYHDSGMGRDEQGNAIPPEELPEGAFWTADLLEAANHLVEVIRDRRPHVVSCYDPFGGYGHPDHIQAHRVTMYAAALAGVPSHRPDLGEAWQVPRLVWSTHNMGKWREALEAARAQGLQVFDDDEAEARGDRMGDPSKIAAVVPFGQYAPQASAALLAHRSQVDSSNEFWQFFEIMRGLDGSGEAYLYAGGVPFPAGDGPAEDLFAGLDLD